MNKEEMIKWIDKATYQQLLGHWRFAEAGDPFFMGEVGDYYKKRLSEKRDEVGHEEAVRVSKTLGWDK